MRQSRLTSEEIIKAEQEADERKRSRANGYSLMKVRDRGYAELRTYYSSPRAKMRWGVDDSNFFELTIGKEKAVFDAEEFRKYLRWV